MTRGRVNERLIQTLTYYTSARGSGSAPRRSGRGGSPSAAACVSTQPRVAEPEKTAPKRERTRPKLQMHRGKVSSPNAYEGPLLLVRQKDAHCEDQFLHISELRGPTHTELRGSFGLCLRRAGLLRGLSFFPRRARAAEEIEDDGPGPVIASKKICERWRQDAPAEVSEASSTPEAVSLTNVYSS